MKKLESKPCRICGKPVKPVRRKDRKAFWYPRQCESCKGKIRNPELHKQHMSDAMSGENHPLYQAIGSKRVVFRRGIPYCQIKITDTDLWQYEHRFVFEQHIGRKLKSQELIHHIDGNSLNNNLGNLVMTTPKSHIGYYHKLNKWSRKYNACVRCSTTDKPHLCRGLCKPCYDYLHYHDKL